MIVKVVLPKNKHTGKVGARVFTRDKKVNVQMEVTDQLKKMMNDKPEAYFHAVLDERDQFSFLEKVNGEKW